MTQKNDLKRFTLEEIRSRKNTDQPLVCLTSYTTPMTKILDPHCDILLVGDSLGMVLYGMDNTLDVTLDMMINHGKAVMRTNPSAFVIVDLPYGTYEDSAEQALENAQRIMNETGCDAVKLEGGASKSDTIQLLNKNNIPVMAHIGLKPQSVVKEGGYKIKGKTEEEALDLINDAKIAQNAGAFGILVEGTIERISQDITKAVEIPTIGIGASAACDGQILVVDDMLGMITDHVPKFVKQYADLASVIGNAAQEYAKDVKSRRFPADEHTYKGKK